MRGHAASVHAHMYYIEHTEFQEKAEKQTEKHRNLTLLSPGTSHWQRNQAENDPWINASHALFDFSVAMYPARGFTARTFVVVTMGGMLFSRCATGPWSALSISCSAGWSIVIPGIEDVELVRCDASYSSRVHVYALHSEADSPT